MGNGEKRRDEQTCETNSHTCSSLHLTNVLYSTVLSRKKVVLFYRGWIGEDGGGGGGLVWGRWGGDT